MTVMRLQTRLIIFTGLVAIFLVTLRSLFKKSDDAELHVVLRYDDFSSTSSQRVENALYRLIDLHNISCSFGIIPFQEGPSLHDQSELIPLSDSKISMIRPYLEEGSIEAAQHGSVHQPASRSDRKSEFAGIPEKEQHSMISAAKKFLDSMFMTGVFTFIPPWNTYDFHTLEVLADLEFKNISADNLQKFKHPHDFNYVPYTALITDLQEILERKHLPLKNNRACIVLMMHDYDFEEIDAERAITNLEAFDSIMQRIIGREWKIFSIQDAVNTTESFDYKRYKWNSHKLGLVRHLSVLSGIEKIFGGISVLRTFYLSTGQVIRILILVIIFYLFIALFIGEGVFLLLNRISLHWNILKVVLISLIFTIPFAGIVFITDDQVLGKNELLLLAAGLGFVTGIMYFRSRKTR